MATSQHTPEHEPRTEAGQRAAAAKVTEADYLVQQADIARKAMTQTFGDVTQKLGQALNLNTVAKDHPWLTVAAGAVAGFATGAAVTPSKTDSALKRLRAIEEALRPQPPVAAYDGVDGHNGKRPAKPSLSQTLLREVFSVVRPLITSGFSALAAAKAASSQAADEVQDQQQQQQQQPAPPQNVTDVNGGANAI